MRRAIPTESLKGQIFGSALFSPSIYDLNKYRKSSLEEFENYILRTG